MSASISLVRQRQTYDCGAACLTMVLSHWGHHSRLSEVRDAVARTGNETSAATLLRTARAWKLDARAFKFTDPSTWLTIPSPAILHFVPGHFVVLAGAEQGRARILDPARGVRLLSAAQLRAEFSGVALVLRPGEGFVARPARSSLARLGDPLRRQLATAPVWMPWIAVSIAGAGALWTVPRQIARLVLDSASFATTSATILALVAGFGASRWIAKGLAVRMVLALDHQLALQTLGALLGKPLEFFRRRTRRELLLTATPNTSLRRALSPDASQSLIDGVLGVGLAVATLITMPVVGVVGLVALALQLGVALTYLRRAGAVASEVGAAEEQTRECVGKLLTGVVEIKQAGTEPAALQRYGEALDHEHAALQQIGAFTARHGAALDTLALLAPIVGVVVGLGLGVAAPAVVLVAAAQLVLAVVLAKRGLQTAVGVAHLARILDDLAQTFDPGEANESGPEAPIESEFRGLAGRELSWREPLGGALVLDRLNFELGLGDALAIVGSEGSGKSLLVDILAGACDPSGGQLWASTEPTESTDSIELECSAAQRRRWARVLRTAPQLREGTIASNLPVPPGSEPESARAAALELVELGEVIASLPLGLHTPISPLGGVLSMAQRQRLVLASALLTAAPIVVIDGGLDALGPRARVALLERLVARGITLVVTADEPSPSIPFTRVLDLNLDIRGKTP